MSSSLVALALHRAIRPMIKLRHFSSLTSSLAALPKTLTPRRILSRISAPCAFTKAVNAGDKIRRTDGDDNILRILEDKIAEQAPLKAEFPKDSPFEVTNNSQHPFPCMIVITLQREFQGEKIVVFVDWRSNWDAVEEKSEKDAAETDDDPRQPYVSLFVEIYKAGLTLNFQCHLYAEVFEIIHVGMDRPEDSDFEKPYRGPHFLDLEEGLRRALNEYLGARGIKVSLYKFLREYLMTQRDRRHTSRLKNLKEFLEK